MSSSTRYEIYIFPNSLKNPKTKYLFWRNDFQNTKNQFLVNANLDMECSAAGKLTFTMPYNHMYEISRDSFTESISSISERLTKFAVVRISNGVKKTIWCGRVLTRNKSFQNFIQYTIEGQWTYLLDIVCRPFTYKELELYYWYDCSGNDNYKKNGSIIKYIKTLTSEEFKRKYELENEQYGKPSYGSPKRETYFKYILELYNNECDSDKKFDIVYKGNTDHLKELSQKELPKRYKNEEYSTIQAELSEAIDDFGGMFVCSFDIDSCKNTLIYCVESDGFPETSNRRIDFGKNLKDFAEELSAETICTKIIPLGDTYSDLENLRKNAYDEWREKNKKKNPPTWEDSGYAMPKDVNGNDRINLTEKVNFWWKSSWGSTSSSGATFDPEYISDNSEPDVLDYYDDSAHGTPYKDYGSVISVVSFKIDTLPKKIVKGKSIRHLPDTKSKCATEAQQYYDELLSKAKKFLKKNSKMKLTLSVSAIDLALLNSENKTSYEFFDIGYKIKVISNPHSINQNLPCTAASLDLITPNNSSWTIGKSYNRISKKAAK